MSAVTADECVDRIELRQAKEADPKIEVRSDFAGEL